MLDNKAKVIACDINETALLKTYADYNEIVCIKMDVCSVKDINEAFEQVKKVLQGERLFAVVNNAGIGIPYALAGIIEKGEQEMQQLFNVNVFGVMRCARVFYPLMIDEENCGKNSGVILNVSSVAGKIGSTFDTFHQDFFSTLLFLFDHNHTTIIIMKKCHIGDTTVQLNLQCMLTRIAWEEN